MLKKSWPPARGFCSTSRLCALILLGIIGSPLSAADWPYWMGPLRNGWAGEFLVAGVCCARTSLVKENAMNVI